MRDLPVVNESGTGYLVDGRPWPGKTFQVAMSFHWPECVAAVKDETGAYHLTLDGSARNAQRYLDAAGFYEGLAAVRDERGWFHIRLDGTPVHNRRCRWSGNFQGGRCVVQDTAGFFHIDRQGLDAYPDRFRYVGDFRDGIAVAYAAAGALHIRTDGRPLNGITYLDAAPFHKGYAVVSDRRGFFHVDRSGKQIYSLRFSSAEPFYNGVALCRGLDGRLLRLRPNGTCTRVADDLEPVTLAQLRDLIAGGMRIGLLVRHAERESIVPGDPTWGNGALLTEQGILDAESFGRTLGGAVRLRVWSSPVERCRQTGMAIFRGAGSSDSIVMEHAYLGDPGIYRDRRTPVPDLMRTDFHAFADPYLDSGLAQGMRPLADASEELLEFMGREMDGADCTVFITHDLFAVALMSYLGLKAPDRSDWCDFLEGVCLLQDGSGEIQYRRFIHHKEDRAC